MGSKSSKDDSTTIKKEVINNVDESDDGQHILKLGDATCITSIFTFIILILITYYLIKKKCKKRQSWVQSQHQSQQQSGGWARRWTRRYPQSSSTHPQPQASPSNPVVVENADVSPPWQTAL